MCFESAYGKYLCVEPDGKVVADRAWDNSWEQFKLERFTDPGTLPNAPSWGSGGGGGSGYGSGSAFQDDDESKRRRHERASSSAAHGAVRAKDRFALRTFHGQYLR